MRQAWVDLVLLTIMTGVTIGVLIVAARGEERVRCAAEPGRGEWHSYKVDGRKCWAKGRSGKYDPSELYWEPTPIQTSPWINEYRWHDPTGWTHQE